MKSATTIWGLLCVILGVILLVVMSLLWALGIWGPSVSALGGVPATGNIDRHFMEQMIPHHEDGVAMSELALTRAEHPELK